MLFRTNSVCVATLLGSFLACHLLLTGQITPHSALKNFKLPKYNEESFREYTISGAEGIYDPLGAFTVKEAQLSLYSGDEHQKLQTTITTDSAVFDLKKDFASGDSVIKINDPDFFLQGTGWTIDMKNKRITIQKEGTIRFYESFELDIDEIFE